LTVAIVARPLNGESGCDALIIFRFLSLLIFDLGVKQKQTERKMQRKRKREL
jgi:hypothetical protein